ncbi:MAG: hypothetical protein AB7S71_13395 [Dongiaceae bacterium]
MATAYIEEPRATRYRQRLAALLRRPSCRWISFAIGAAPVHRDFFADTAASIEGLPTGGIREWNGVSRRQVQYGVRLRVLDGAGRATYEAERDLLVVPEEAEFDSLDGQARLIGACVHVGLAMKGRDLQWLDSESAARIAGHLYRLFETIADGDSDAEVAEKLQLLAPDTPQEREFYDSATEILQHRRATWLANMRVRHALEPGSFMKIIRVDRRDRLHRLLLQGTSRKAPAPVRPSPAASRAKRFLALQELEPMAPPLLRA